MAAFDSGLRPDGPEKPLSNIEHGDILRTIRRSAGPLIVLYGGSPQEIY
jgi:hypothetical protein